MAVTQNTLIGRSRGSVGGVTFTKWKGLNVIKSKPESVENPQTIPQQTQRNRLTRMVEIYRGIASAVQVGFKSLAVNQSEYNAFVSENIINGTTVLVAPAVEPNFPGIFIAKGSMEETPYTVASAAAAQPDVDLAFSATPSGIGQASSDLAYAVVINKTQGNGAQLLGTSLRSAAAATITMPSNLASSDELEIYLFFKEDGSDTVSDSVYLAHTVS